MKANTLRFLPHFLLFALLTPAISKPFPCSDPDNTGGWTLNPAVSDEFDGDSLNLNKWLNLGLDGDYHGEWKGRAPSQFNPANVRTSRWKSDHHVQVGSCF